MNRNLLRIILSLFDLITSNAEQFRYDDKDNKEFWSSIRQDVTAIKRRILDKFDM